MTKPPNDRDIEDRLRELRAISERCGRLLRDAPPGPSAVEHGDFLYDENGLPKSTNLDIDPQRCSDEEQPQ